MTDPDEPLDGRAIEEGLLGKPLRYTRKEVADLSGVPEGLGALVWQALGFPAPPDDEVAFTDNDVAALRDIKELLDHDLVDEEMVLHLSRAVGQTMGRLANWLDGVWVQRLRDQVPEGQAPTEEMVAALFTATEELRPKFEELLLHGWRRQIAAAAMRSFSTAAATGDPANGTVRMAVGFADVVSFTRLSRRMDGDALAAFVERFEATAAEVVAEQGGRLVKTLGDEVLFAADDDPRTAAEIGLRIAERCEEDPDFPQVRVGLAFGEVILRLGDVFGTPVNLAARLTSVAYPGTVLMDGELARAIADDESYETSTLRARPLQGLGRVRPRVLRRRSANGARKEGFL